MKFIGCMLFVLKIGVKFIDPKRVKKRLFIRNLCDCSFTFSALFHSFFDIYETISYLELACLKKCNLLTSVCAFSHLFFRSAQYVFLSHRI